jgi:hypothetical protein
MLFEIKKENLPGKAIVAQTVKFPALSESEVSLPCSENPSLLHIHSRINPDPIPLRTC